jgi:hypothetical protein
LQKEWDVIIKTKELTSMMQDESDKLHTEIVYSTPRSNHFRRSSKTSTFSQGLFSNRNNEGSEDFQITDSY